MLGAVFGSAVNRFLYGSTIKQYEAANGIVRSTAHAVVSAKTFGEDFAAPVTVTQAFAAEAFGTAVLASAIFALTHPNNDATNNNPFNSSFRR